MFVGRYVMKVATDATLFNKHIAWKSGRREDLSDKFWFFWSKPQVSGDWGWVGCNFVFINFRSIPCFILLCPQMPNVLDCV
jgi:hypothetical protein